MTSATHATLPHPLRGTHQQPANDDASVAPGDIAVGVVIGRASEYFDFFVYGIASVLVFPAVFFPFADKLQGLLYAFALFAVAFVVRPVGTLVGMLVFLALIRMNPPDHSCSKYKAVIAVRPLSANISTEDRSSTTDSFIVSAKLIRGATTFTGKSA